MGSIRVATFAKELPCVKQLGSRLPFRGPLALARALGSGEGVRLRRVSLTSPYLITVAHEAASRHTGQCGGVDQAIIKKYNSDAVCR